MSLGQLIRQNANSLMIEPELIAAVIAHESVGDKWASRFEEGFYEKFLKSKLPKDLAGYIPGPPVSFYDEKLWRAHSYGYMQVLGDTARVFGFKGQYMAELFEPAVNLHYGCLKLVSCQKRALSFRDQSLTVEQQLLLYYNGGVDRTYSGKVLAQKGGLLTRRLLDD